MNQPLIADATPSKSFFIDMLTRDISVADAILDLVDNAIDKAVELEDLDVTRLLNAEVVDHIQNRVIDISMSPAEFSIRDTCGGIGLKEAEESVFRFGNPDERGADFGLSVYGIGMKRALFKLGSSVDMRSDTASDWWELNWPIATWRKNRRWKVSIDSWGTHQDPPAATGTEIRVTDLLTPIAQQFSQPSFRRELMDRLASTYALFLTAGVEMTVNGERISAQLPQFASDPVAPARRAWSTEGVDVLMIVGLSPIEDQEPRGWYVYCNGRMVLEADKTVETGWGDVLPQFRSKYNHFLGHIFFKSEDVRRLPWRTTKQGVERELPVYQNALGEMRLYARPVVDFLNDLYPSDAQSDPSLQRETLQDAKPASITALPVTDRSFVYAVSPRQARTDISIQFRRERADIERVRRYLGDQSMSAGAVGAYTFDYFLDQELD